MNWLRGRGVRMLAVFILTSIFVQGISNSQYDIRDYMGATNRFENADGIYGVFGTIDYPFNTQPIHYNRVYIMEGQWWWQDDYSYVAFGWYRHQGVEGYFAPLFFWRKKTGEASIGAIQDTFPPHTIHNYGIEYRYQQGEFRFFIDGIPRQPTFPTAGIFDAAHIPDYAVAGTWIGPNLGIPTPIVGSTFSELQWVKRKASGGLGRKPWTFNFVDMRSGPYTCDAFSANQIMCHRT